MKNYLRGHPRATIAAVVSLALLLGGAVVLATQDGEAATGRTPAAALEDASAPQAPAADDITLAFAGDVHFEGALMDVPGMDGATLGPMSQTLKDADLAMVNLETSLTTRGAPASKELEDPGNRYWFRARPSALGVLERSGVDVVAVANNHAADYGVTGLRDTLGAGARSPVALVGAGLDADQALTPHRVTVKGTDVAVFAADASPRESRDPVWAVTPGSGPGIVSARGADADPLVAAVRASAAVDDLVVVYLHWGEENASCPTADQASLARALTDAGADVIVGSHAHLQLGAGELDGAYVSYGLGNFFWYHGRSSETGVLQLRVRAGQVVDDQWLPARIRADGGNAQPLEGAEAAAAEASWRQLRACTDLAPGPAEAGDDLPAYAADVAPISASLRSRMRSHDPATCPVPLRDLRRVATTYVGFDGRAHDGAVVVNADVADDVVELFRVLYAARFPIRRMRLIDVYGGDDNASMAANNTSGYNCRRVAGSDAWSEHAYGRAIDIDPVQNPYVIGARALPPAGRPYVDVDRSGAPVAPGVIREGDVVTGVLARLGWTWGGTYSEPDFQHFSKP